MSVFGKLNKMDLLAYSWRFVFEAYFSTIIQRNGNGKFILVPKWLHY